MVVVQIDYESSVPCVAHVSEDSEPFCDEVKNTRHKTADVTSGVRTSALHACQYRGYLPKVQMHSLVGLLRCSHRRGRCLSRRPMLVRGECRICRSLWWARRRQSRRPRHRSPRWRHAIPILVLVLFLARDCARQSQLD